MGAKTASSTLWRARAAAAYPDHPDLAARIEALLAEHSRAAEDVGSAWSERDALLITYADQFQTSGETPLASLHRFYLDHLRPWISGIHILPFYPWSSDDGYSVIDYKRVDPRYGDWRDIEAMARDTRLMFDAVVNHASAGSEWLLGYLADDQQYEDFFVSLDPDTDLSSVVRPRTSPLLTRFETSSGPRWLWTTFSADQVDLNYRNPEVFLAVLDVLLTYAAHGASLVRLDAVQFLGKEVGTSSINLPEAHHAIQLLRACMDTAYPGVPFVTETNVPHRENLSYFGNGDREAQVVYQFALPPLVLDALHSGTVEFLARWIDELEDVPPGCTFLNFLSSHDGVGVRPVEGILPQERVDSLVDLTRSGGGQVGVRSVGDHTAPYELNTTWFSLMETGYDVDAAIRRHLAAHAVMLAVRGIPAIYALSLIGGRSDQAGFAETGRARSLNRKKFHADELARELAEPASVAARVKTGLEGMLRWRRATPAFHPDSPQRVLDAPHGVLGIERGKAAHRARVYINVGPEPIGLDWPGDGWSGFDIAPADGRIVIGAFSSVWLRKDS